MPYAICIHVSYHIIKKPSASEEKFKIYQYCFHTKFAKRNDSNIVQLSAFCMGMQLISVYDLCVHVLLSHETYAEVTGNGRSNTAGEYDNSTASMHVEDGGHDFTDDDSSNSGSDYDYDTDGEPFVLPRGTPGQKHRTKVHNSTGLQDPKPPSKRGPNFSPCTTPPPPKSKPSNSVISYKLLLLSSTTVMYVYIQNIRFTTYSAQHARVICYMCHTGFYYCFLE